MHKLKLLFSTSRPVSWVNTAYPFAAGYLLLGGGIDPVFIIGTLFFLIPYNLVMYGINDVFDYDSDIVNPRKGGVEGAITPKSFHRTILWASLIVSVPFVIALALLGNALNTSVLGAVLFFVVAYSIKGLRFKEVAFLDSITSSIHFVGPLVYAASFFAFPAAALPYLLAFFLWGVASHAFGAVQDIKPDRAGGITSIAVIIGARWTIYFSLLLYIACALILLLQGNGGVVAALVTLMYIVNTSLYLGVKDDTSDTTRPGWRRFLWMNYLGGAIVTVYVAYRLVMG